MDGRIPLAERMRPQTLDEYVGQEHLFGVNGQLRPILESGVIPSMILWGPPGVGKTTLAHLIAKVAKRPFFTLSAVSSGVKDVREVIQKAEEKTMFSENGTLLFIDEIHRFSKSQQDSLLAAVEKGTITLIGATTENPSFEVNSALLSRCQVYTLKELEKKHLETIVKRALEQDPLLSEKKIKWKSADKLYALSSGDSRRLLNLLELLINSSKESTITIDDASIEQMAASQMMRYDKQGENHYDVVSAFIKSIRGSDPNAAVYWLARMIEGGEDPKFIARRMLISAAEDIGLANPTALVMANNTFQAIQAIGMPEGRIILSQCAIYLASSPKGNAAYRAINEALSAVRETGPLPVPLHLRNAPTRLMKELGYGEDYLYSHDYSGNFVQQEFMPEGMQGQSFIHAGSSARELETLKWIKAHWGNKYEGNQS